MATEKEIRKRVWYKRWCSEYSHVFNILDDGNGEIDKHYLHSQTTEILNRMDRLINSIHGYKYNWIAASSAESLEQCLKDMEAIL